MKFGIAKKVVLLFVLSVAILGVALGTYFVKHEEKALLLELNERANALLGSLAKSSEYPVLLKDKEMLSSIATGVLNQKDVIFCQIKDSRGEVLFEEGRREEENVEKYAASILSEKLETEELVLGASKENLEEIGQVYLILSLNRMKAQLKQAGKTTGLIIALSLLLASLFIALLIRYLLGEPIKQLVLGTEMVAKGNLNYEVPVKTRDEIGELAASFNKMAEDLLLSTAEKEKMQQELQKAWQIESIGLLAAGIAHDFNNILSAILLNAQMARMQKDKDIEKFLDGIEKATYRATGLTKQLLTFSKGGVPIKEAVSVSKLLKETTEFALHGSNAGCKFSIDDDLFPIEADRTQISQVINNLVINAVQAMPEGGIIEIKAENLILGKSQGLPLKEGKYIKVSVKDSGVGIPKEEFAKVFDPYWTTKHKGNGLGLTTVYSIIKRHNGHITLDSELGAGTTFHIYLPAPETKMSIEKDEAEQILKGEGRILLVDDEEDILESAGGALRELGYEAETAKDGDEAISLYVQARKPFDLVIMDLTIPGRMGGKAAIKKLLEIDPGAKAIVSSGYSNDPIMADFAKYGFCGVLHKPYKIGEMSRVLHKILES